MKTKLSLFLLILALSPVPFALSQIPQGFNYQAIARDGSGNILPNTPLQAMMYVQSLSTGGTIFWKELHSTITTNSFGLFTLVVGTGTRQIESTAATFNLIDWSVTPKFLKTEIYYSGSWKDMGTSQLMSVPYAMTSGDLAGTVDKLAVKGTTSGLEDALFEVKNKDGQTVFAVYNEGVRVYVSDGAKAVKGGFAVGGFGTDKAESTKYLFVGKDSVRIYLDTNPLTKGVKSGFAVGGYDLTKGTIQNYLDVNADSTRIYVKNQAKGVKGGFAVGGFDMTKGATVPYMSLTPDNYFIGHESGLSNTTGLYNSFFGYKTGRSNTTGTENIFIGHQSGTLNTSGSGNLFIGDSAGVKNTIGNLNVFLGGYSGWENTTGFQNISIGYGAGLNNINGNRNIYIGTAAGTANKAGILNVSIGNFAGSKSVGAYNVYLGSRAGMNDSTGSGNVFIGFMAGVAEYEISNRLYVANSGTNSPLIFGEFDNSRLVINGNSNNNTNDRTLYVNGTAGSPYAWYNDSDKRLKHDIVTIPDALEKVMELRGVNFLWNDPADGLEGTQMGFIGQEAAEIVPEVVSVINDRYSMQYAPITALLVEGMKEQQQQIESVKLENKQLKSEIDDLKALVNNLIENHK
jgi:hypothetical protein